MRVSESQSTVWGQNSTVYELNVLKVAHSKTNGLEIKDPGKMNVQLVKYKLNCTENNREQDITTSKMMNQLSSKLSYRVCIHHEVPLRSISSVVILDKSLCISLVELVDGRKEVQPALYRSSTFCLLGVSSQYRAATDEKLSKTTWGYGRGRAAMLGSNKYRGRDEGLGHCKSSQLKHQKNKAHQTSPVCGSKPKANDSDREYQSASFGLLSFRALTSSDTKTAKQKENADEADFFARSYFRNRQPSFCISTDSGTWSKAAGRTKTGADREDGKPTEPQTVSTCHNYCGLKNDSVGDLGLQMVDENREALELFRPDFISQSQSRVRRLEQMARRRKGQKETKPDLVRGLKEERGRQKRNCTTPDPLSNNLFKPRERSISGREMQLRSRRIYNKLPEVTKKKEEEKKRAVSQSNRLRAEVFKKRLLDQILQR